jgi:hypothetical protein
VFYFSQLSGGRYLLPILLASFLIIGGCESTGPQYSETDCKDCPPKEKPPDIPALTTELGYECFTDSTLKGGYIFGSVEGIVDSIETRYYEINPSGDTVGTGTVPKDGQLRDSVDYNGQVTLRVSDADTEQTNRSSQASATVDCDTGPVKPGVSGESECMANKPDGKLVAVAENGLNSWKIFRVETGEVIRSEDGLTPEDKQEIVVNNLPDGDLRFEGELDGETDQFEFSVSCDGPGDIGINSECVFNDDETERTETVTVTDVNQGSDVYLEDGEGERVTDIRENVEAGNVVFAGQPVGEYRGVAKKNNNTSKSEYENQTCPLEGPEAPTFADGQCINQQGQQTYSVDPTAQGYELRRSEDDSVARSGDVNGREQLTFTNLDDGEYYLILFKNDKSARSSDKNVSCDLKTRSCVYTFTGENFVAGKAKFRMTELATAKTILEFEPETTPRAKVKLRTSQADQTLETYALGFVADGDTVFTEIQPDPDNSGSGERWMTDTFTLSESVVNQLERGKDYKLIAVHGSYLGGDDNDGVDSVFFSTEQEDGRIVIEYEFVPDN